MITNFESVTYNTSSLEEAAAKYLAKYFNKYHKGKKNSIKSSKISKILSKKNKNWIIADARLRKLINLIRSNGWSKCLVATSKGYYVSNSRKEIESYLISLDERTNEIMKIRNLLHSQYATKFKLKKNKTSLLKVA